MSTKAEKIRSKEDEEALDRKIAEIRKRNQLIQQRKEIVDEDRAAFEDQYRGFAKANSSASIKSENENTEKVISRKSSQNNEWDREWDVGKTRAETWIENVPEMGLTWRGHKKKRGYHGRGRRGGASGLTRKEYSMHDDRFESPSYGKEQTATEEGSGEAQSFTEEKTSMTNIEQQQSRDQNKRDRNMAGDNVDQGKLSNRGRGRGARRRSAVLEQIAWQGNAGRKHDKPAEKVKATYEKRVEIVKRRGGLSDTIRVKLTNLSVKEENSNQNCCLTTSTTTTTTTTTTTATTITTVPTDYVKTISQQK